MWYLCVTFCRIWAVYAFYVSVCVTSMFHVSDIYVLNILGILRVTVLYPRSMKYVCVVYVCWVWFWAGVCIVGVSCALCMLHGVCV